MDEREFEVTGRVWVDKEAVLIFLGKDIDDDADYEPTDSEWLSCAYKLFENDEIYWSESGLELLK